jgi:hypothetical protein
MKRIRGVRTSDKEVGLLRENFVSSSNIMIRCAQPNQKLIFTRFVADCTKEQSYKILQEMELNQFFTLSRSRLKIWRERSEFYVQGYKGRRYLLSRMTSAPVLELKMTGDSLQYYQCTYLPYSCEGNTELRA